VPKERGKSIVHARAAEFGPYGLKPVAKCTAPRPLREAEVKEQGEEKMNPAAQKRWFVLTWL
jgi:hypothetical protein